MEVSALKVVLPVGDLHVGGGCKVLVDIANALHVNGHEVEIVIPQTGTVKYDVKCKITVVPELSKETIPYGDLVLPNFYTTFRPAFEAWPEQCVRLSLGFEPYWVPQRDRALWTYQQDVPIVSISQWLDEQIFLHTKKRSRVVNLGVDSLVFFPSKIPRICKKINKKVILYIARDPAHGYELKGFRDFQVGIELVKQQYVGDFVVHMICPENALSLPGIPYQTFAPNSERQMAKRYRRADVFVSSSWFEAFALPPLEAMACGTPVITTDSGGVLDFCVHMDSAYITPPKAPDELAKGILAVLRDQALSERLREGGLEAAKRLTKERFEKTMIETLEVLHHERVGR
jgi:glycosyltransferase involved in cell wall biosynthesis